MLLRKPVWAYYKSQTKATVLTKTFSLWFGSMLQITDKFYTISDRPINNVHTTNVCSGVPWKASMSRMTCPLVDTTIYLPSGLNFIPVQSQSLSCGSLKVANGPYKYQWLIHQPLTRTSYLRNISFIEIYSIFCKFNGDKVL